MEDVMSEVKQYIVSNFPVAKRKKVQCDDVLLESGIIDSLGVMEIVHYLVDRFEIEIDEDDLVPENFRTVRSISVFVQLKRNGNGNV